MTRALRLVDPGVAEAREWAAFYRSKGFNPLPKRDDANKPCMSTYRRERDEGVSPGLIDAWWTSGIQVATGVRWGLAVVDLDGPFAIARWDLWARQYPTPPTWTVESGGGGRHLWFATPPGLESLPSRNGTRALWSLPGAKHSSVDLLGDRALAVCPPSVHPRTGRPYRWASGRSPLELDAPALLPGWVLALALHEPRRFVPLPLSRPAHAGRPPLTGERYHSRDVLDAIGDGKLDLAEGWGLKVACAGPNPSGWVKCHAIGREDRNPSASFSFPQGTYIEPAVGMASKLSLFELGVSLGQYADWREARDDLGRLYRARPMNITRPETAAHAG